jgi:hypothetical protein
MPVNEKKLIKWSSIIATMGTSILAITALITVTVTLNAWKVQREAARPYLSLKESPKVEVQSGLNMEFRFNNVGIHPALNLSSQTIVFDQSLKNSPVHNDQYNLVNEIPKDMSSSLVIALDQNEVDVSQPKLDPYYIVVHLEYADPLINHHYSQTLYFKWNGIVAGNMQPVVHIEVSEKESILEYLKSKQINLSI